MQTAHAFLPERLCHLGLCCEHLSSTSYLPRECTSLKMCVLPAVPKSPSSDSQASVQRQPSQGGPTAKPGQPGALPNGSSPHPPRRPLSITAPQGGPTKSSPAKPKAAASIITTAKPSAPSGALSPMTNCCKSSFKVQAYCKEYAQLLARINFWQGSAFLQAAQKKGLQMLQCDGSCLPVVSS